MIFKLKQLLTFYILMGVVREDAQFTDHINNLFSKTKKLKLTDISPKNVSKSQKHLKITKVII